MDKLRGASAKKEKVSVNMQEFFFLNKKGLLILQQKF